MGGYAFIIGVSAISWTMQLQRTIALSLLEAEYMALTQAAKEAIWIKTYLMDLNIAVTDPIVIMGDNQGTLALARNPVYHSRTKHIDVQHHFI